MERPLVPGSTTSDAPSTDETTDAVEPFDLGEEDLATRITHARQRHGIAGAALAAGMLGLDQALYGRKPKEEIPIVVDASGEPTDVDRDGISLAIEDAGVHVAAPPLPRTPPVVAPARRPRRWR